MAALMHLIYCSAATCPMNRNGILELLRGARTKNAELGVTGMLLFCEGSFFQVLEGEEETLTKLFDLIAADERHDRVTTIIKEYIPARTFGQWTMAFAGASAKQLAEIDGLNDFFDDGSCLADIDNGRAKKLLEAFARGRWRAALE